MKRKNKARKEDKGRRRENIEDGHCLTFQECHVPQVQVMVMAKQAKCFGTGIGIGVGAEIL